MILSVVKRQNQLVTLRVLVKTSTSIQNIIRRNWQEAKEKLKDISLTGIFENIFLSLAGSPFQRVFYFRVHPISF
jgi:ribosomal protein L39E